MADLRTIADRSEIEALRCEFTDAVVMDDHDRLASLFTPGGAVRIPDAGLEAVGREAIRAMGARRGGSPIRRLAVPPGTDPRAASVVDPAGRTPGWPGGEP